MSLMNLISGQFPKEDALDILTRMVHAKISYHEQKIHASLNEEDIKMRENRIKQLQKDLYHCRKEMDQKEGMVRLSAQLELA